jgi:integrase/recombinase XerD
MYLLKDVLQEFLFEIQIKNYTVRTIKSYRNNNNLFITYLSKEFNIDEIDKVSPIHIKQYIKFLNKQGRKPTYINTILKNIRSYFEYCVQEDYISISPAMQVKWQKEDKTIIQAFTNEEVIKMLNVYDFSDYLNTRNKIILATLFDTGIRNLELCQLINTDIRESIIRIFGKGNKERYVSISPMLKKYMIKYERAKEFYFKNKIINFNNYFLSNTGKPLTKEAIERIVKLAGSKAIIREEIRCSPHTCCHYFAQSQLRNGLDVYSLSRLLGHDNINITKTYLQSLQDENIVEMSVKTSPLMNLR